MSPYYLDASAIVKRYSPEIGTAWVKALTDPGAGHTIVLGEITLAEVAAAIAAKHRAPDGITVEERNNAVALFLSHCMIDYELVAINRSIIDRAVNLTLNHKLRGYDAVQLATALVANAALPSLVAAVPGLQGARSPLRPPGYAVYASPILFAMLTTMTPPWTQGSLRVGQGHLVFRTCACQSFPSPSTGEGEGGGEGRWRTQAMLLPPHPGLPPRQGGRGRRPREARGKSRTEWPCGWVAIPYPTGTFTLQEMPSLSWRDNARLHLLPEAGATQERRLKAVSSMPLFGSECGRDTGPPPRPYRAGASVKLAMQRPRPPQGARLPARDDAV